MKTKQAVFVISVMIALLFAGGMMYRDQLQNRQSGLQTVWDLSVEAMDATDRSLLIKHASPFGSYTNRADFERSAGKLSEKLGLPRGTIEMHGIHPVYKVKVSGANGGNIALTLTGDDAGKTYLVITRQSLGEQSLQQAEIWKQNTSMKLKAAGIAPDWNFVVQGLLRSYDNDPASFFRLVQTATSAAVIEQYEDVNTFSSTYYSAAISSSVRSGEQSVNLQAASHKITETNEWRVTIGTPLITIEY
ncbi:hypothetical protein BG53_02770 [Paenibacillus darwinianus]|uniref:TATA-box binding protein n=1 Tax=Paenibacillus darwinianus TaxID=1380763 RepID=A0A9W5S062_9BACL|nr:YwmB family TATA-box binding protein [Paenibacillus darwinianus]EXX87948.1 hypothetical protein BG53_02770 [Paenibacillus darwinianus]EXX88368.1 hypothetical protein BG52_02265 [Paenibacillus darwinianus]EXX88405.1 hypothetical protein CH50_03570 [Paenibacillus darwinianus]